MTDGVITKKGVSPGKTLTIMAGVHGDEICGPEAFKELIPTLDIKRGTVHFIVANLEALTLGERQVDMNLNRAFRPNKLLTAKERGTYERKRALELMPYLRESEALLDVHSSMTKKSKPFIICEPHSFPIAKRLRFGIRSHGWDVIEAGGTDYFMNTMGKIGICIECGNHNDPKAPKLARESIIRFLTIMGAIDGRLPRECKSQKVMHAFGIYKTETNFRKAREFEDFEPLPKGTPIGYDGKKKVLAPENMLIIFPRNQDLPGKEAFILGRYE